MAKEVEEVKDEVVEVKDETVYVSTKDAFKSIGHNLKEYVKDPETYKRAGKRIAKVAVLAGIGLAVSKGTNALLNKNEDNNEEWIDDDIIDGEVVEDNETDETTETEVTNDETTEE